MNNCAVICIFEFGVVGKRDTFIILQWIRGKTSRDTTSHGSSFYARLLFRKRLIRIRSGNALYRSSILFMHFIDPMFIVPEVYGLGP